MVPELPIAMLACARIGAIHNVVFSGFSSQALSCRVNFTASKVILTADKGVRRGKSLDLKGIVDQALDSMPSIEHVIILKRTASNTFATGPKDIWWHDITDDVPTYCEPEIVDSMHLCIFFLLLEHQAAQRLFYVLLAAILPMLTQQLSGSSILEMTIFIFVPVILDGY
jgi:acyl-coenzyme A synthetase/AMP-(fatty) acid ligase